MPNDDKIHTFQQCRANAYLFLYTHSLFTFLIEYLTVIANFGKGFAIVHIEIGKRHHHHNLICRAVDSNLKLFNM